MVSAKNTFIDIVSNMLQNLGDHRDAVTARLKASREALGLSKKEFAEMAGLTEQVYGPFENARRDLSLSAAKKLRARHKLSLEFLYFGMIEDLPTRISTALRSNLSVK
ncbi:putative transcriptional regulator [Octadecabacter antarcticus 307]|uniref:Putative transcriptional regulator n=1 Tax=Octadecabacter antarcticus 307 TaxID=391626 RepID=M9R6U8_9RHOB|nr:helix-turn-helix transcriptional regulator [Octadecabacter antarcticus]AGI67468.1 putative transcriptional regulator [Octadecabacter antarcticus 307]